MRLREIPEDFQRIIKWAIDGKEAIDVTYLDHKGSPRVTTATVHDAKGERIWLVGLNGLDIIFGYQLLLDVTPSLGFPVA